MAWWDPFLLGPLGAMRALPSPPHGSEVDVSVTRFGGIRTSLGGRSTQDTWANKAGYVFEWSERYREDLELLQRMWRGMTRRPLRLLDPMGTVNLLSPQCASVGAEPDRKPLRAFDVAARPVVWAPILDVPADLDLVEGGLRWAVAADLDDMLRGDVAHRVPVLGRSVTVSIYARGAGTALAAVEPYDAAGVAGAPTYGAETALSATEWSRLTVTLPEGSAAVSAVPGLAVAAGAARTVEAVGWQAQHGPLTPWERGGACPRVLLVEHGGAYLRQNRRKLSLTLREV